MRGKITDSREIETASSYVGVDLRGGCYTIIIAGISGYDSLISRDVLLEVNMAKAVLINAAQKTMEKRVYPRDIDKDKLAFIIISSRDGAKAADSKTDGEKLIKSLLDETARFVKARFFLAVGSETAKLENLHRSFEHAIHVPDCGLGTGARGNSTDPSSVSRTSSPTTKT